MTQTGREQLWGEFQQMSKHSLLRTLLQRIRHINDVAVLLHAWVVASTPLMGWFVNFDGLGQWGRHADMKSSYDFWSRQGLHARLQQLHNKVLAAFSIGHVAFSHYDSHPRDMAEFAAFAKLADPWGMNDGFLAFFCALHRLQQLPPNAVLARLHSIFSRCCRFDLLLLTNCLANWHVCAAAEAIWSEFIPSEAIPPEAHADDIFTAFGANRRCTMAVVAQVSPSDKVKIKELIHKIVDAWVNMENIWNGRGFCSDVHFC